MSQRGSATTCRSQPCRVRMPVWIDIVGAPGKSGYCGRVPRDSGQYLGRACFPSRWPGRPGRGAGDQKSPFASDAQPHRRRQARHIWVAARPPVRRDFLHRSRYDGGCGTRAHRPRWQDAIRSPCVAYVTPSKQRPNTTRDLHVPVLHPCWATVCYNMWRRLPAWLCVQDQVR